MSVVTQLANGTVKVHVSKSRKAKGLPKRVHNACHKASYTRYLGRSTCFPCQLVFRSPKYKAAHVASAHTECTGVASKK